MKDFFNSAAAKLITEFNSESPAALIKDSTFTDSNKIKRLKKVKNDERVMLFCERFRKHRKRKV